MGLALLKTLDTLKDYDVHYCIEAGDDFVFRCRADDRTHALQQFITAEPEATVIGVWPTEEMDYAGANCNAQAP